MDETLIVNVTLTDICNAPYPDSNPLTEACKRMFPGKAVWLEGDNVQCTLRIGDSVPGEPEFVLRGGTVTVYDVDIKTHDAIGDWSYASEHGATCAGKHEAFPPQAVTLQAVYHE